MRFADIRGSTALAERTSASAFRALLQEFYRIASRVVDHHDGILDKFLGDGAMALFIPVVSGENHSGRAIEAGEDLLALTERPPLASAGAHVGVGVHRGPAFVGVLGAEDRLGFSALGDTVNVAARLGGLAGPGELLASRTAWEHAGRAVDGIAGIELRHVAVAGREAPLDVVAVSPARAAVT